MSTNRQSSVNTTKGKIIVYFLAAPEDEEQTKAVKKYLSPVIRSSKIPIEILSDFEIPPGQDINEYKLQLYDSDIVLAFISADFINDDQTYIRTQKVIERYNKDETVMLPILVRNCMWKSTPFVNLPLLPKNTQPLNNKQYWNSEDDALTSVVNDIYESINKFSYEKAQEEPAESDISELLSDAAVEEAPIEDVVSTLTPEIEEVISELAPEAEVKESVVEEAVLEITPEVESSKDIGGLVEQLEEISEPKPVEQAPAAPEVKKVEPEPIKTKVEGKDKSHVDLQVDWRKEYYRRVLWKRAAAFILDQILTFIPLIFIGQNIGIIGSIFFGIDDSMFAEAEELKFGDLFVIIIFPMLFYFVICAIVESSKYKGTFGKLIMRMEITDGQGERIGFFRAFFRNIFRFCTGYLYLLIIPFIFQIISYIKSKKLFHDHWTNTIVGERLKKEKRT